MNKGLETNASYSLPAASTLSHRIFCKQFNNITGTVSDILTTISIYCLTGSKKRSCSLYRRSGFMRICDADINDDHQHLERG
jgi:hypothetical protein